MSADFEGTSGPDYESGNYGMMHGYGGADWLSSGATFARIYGGTEGDYVGYYGSGTSKLYGDSGDDTLYGGDQKDKMYGGTGDDWLFGGLGKNIMWGGKGSDHFVFDSLPDGYLDKIKDFKVKKDFLNFDPSAYPVGMSMETLDASQFRYGKKAKDGDDNFGYNKKTGKVWFDPDGKGGEAQVDVVKLDKDLHLTYANFQF